jgi:hypothetical protein
VLDLDGNGQLDVAIPDGLGSRVLVYLVRAPVAGATQIDAPLVIDIPRGTVPIPSASVASAGDVNEDGFDDLLVGGRGTVDLYLGGSTGPATRAARFRAWGCVRRVGRGWARRERRWSRRCRGRRERRARDLPPPRRRPRPRTTAALRRRGTTDGATTSRWSATSITTASQTW